MTAKNGQFHFQPWATKLEKLLGVALDTQRPRIDKCLVTNQLLQEFHLNWQ